VLVHELADVWTDRKGLCWIAVTAFLYALILIPFNQYHWDIAGISLRTAAVLPVVFGILWGPAAAWGLGIGNVAGDLFGSWSLMSIFGFINNVVYTYLSYRFWHWLMRDHPIRMDGFGLGCFWVVSLVMTFTCMFLLATCGTIFFSRPFESKFISYFGNSIVWVMVGGPILFKLLIEPAYLNKMVYGRQWDLRETFRAK